METADETTVFDIQKIQEILPHRYPFLMIDRVTTFEDNQKVVAIKCVTMNEPYFTGHFPGRPVMPGVMILEAMAQAGAILALKSSEGVIPGKIIFLTGATDVRFKKQVTPGDVLRIEMRSVKKRRPLWIMEGEVTVNGKVVCSGSITAAEAD
jgi:3-hydroxyacyl-[acyl-carrier-protein] dehydratase